jgi:hypothetical protein
MNPPRKSLGIHDLLLPLATRETHSAINHKNKASLRITIADYTTGRGFAFPIALYSDQRITDLFLCSSPCLRVSVVRFGFAFPDSGDDVRCRRFRRFRRSARSVPPSTPPTPLPMYPRPSQIGVSLRGSIPFHPTLACTSATRASIGVDFSAFHPTPDQCHPCQSVVRFLGLGWLIAEC